MSIHLRLSSRYVSLATRLQATEHYEPLIQAVCLLCSASYVLTLNCSARKQDQAAPHVCDNGHTCVFSDQQLSIQKPPIDIALSSPSSCSLSASEPVAKITFSFKDLSLLHHWTRVADRTQVLTPGGQQDIFPGSASSMTSSSEPFSVFLHCT
ncbi:hypothetical protein Slin14017_G123240 [Septoria linicola]|nr:hypothetical protein Slin14017_G123240 [Septoria linicola]